MLGFHFVQALEFCSSNTGNNAFVGDNDSTWIQSGLSFEWRF